MKKILIPNTSIEVSKFIFGTASLLKAGSHAKRQSILESAIDAGFTHFDTAPYYGFGTSEQDLMPILRRHPSITVTSKVGIWSPGSEHQSTFSALLRKTGGKIFPFLSRAIVDFSVSCAQNALTGSIKRLGRERIDIYMLHEPMLEIINTDEWQRWLEDRQSSGHIGYYGMALTRDKLKPFLQKKSRLAELVQMEDSLDRKEADLLREFNKPIQITYGYVSSARKRGNYLPIESLLKEAVSRNPYGAIIVTTKQPHRMNQYQKILIDINDNKSEKWR